MKRIKTLDGLRGVAIIYVLFNHVFFIKCGWIGVQIFFVLSGYLITSNLLNNIDFPIGLYLKHFYWRRLLRISPVYFLYIFILLVTYHIFQKPASFYNELPYLITYTFNFTKCIKSFINDSSTSHLWSLSLEEQFYFVWPFLIYYFRQTRLKTLMLTILIISPLLRYYNIRFWDSPESTNINLYFTGTQLDAFAYGAMIPAFDLGKKIKKPLIWFLISFFVLLLVGLLTIHNDNLEKTSMKLVWSYTIVNLFSATLILLLISNNKHSIKMIFSNRIITSIGVVSYGMYIYHMLILNAFNKILTQIGVPMNWFTFLIYIGIVYIVSYTSYRILELKFLKLKDKMLNDPKTSQPTRNLLTAF